jgi:hypothetical protein
MVHGQAQLFRDFLVTCAFKARQNEHLSWLFIQVGQGVAQALGQFAGLSRLNGLDGSVIDVSMFR